MTPRVLGYNRHVPLTVFDFVDNAGRYSQSWSLHRLTKTSTYRPCGYVLATDERIAEERARGEAPPVVLNIGIWPERFEEVAIFDGQSEVKGLLSTADLDLALATRRWWMYPASTRGRNCDWKGSLWKVAFVETTTRMWSRPAVRR